MVSQGEIYWAELHPPVGSEPGFRRPVLVVQNDIMNITAIRTYICCPLTSNLQRANIPGNVILKSGETGLQKDSLVQACNMLTIDESRLHEYVGKISRVRIREVVRGIHLLIDVFEGDLYELEKELGRT